MKTESILRYIARTPNSHLLDESQIHILHTRPKSLLISLCIFEDENDL
jgi:hypothetical protein